VSDDVLILDGFDELLAALDAAPEVAMPIFDRYMLAALRMIQSEVASYPPASEANQPGRFSLRTRRPMGYYERGRGWWYPLMQSETLRKWGTLAGYEEGIRDKPVFGSTRRVIRASRAQRGYSKVVGYKLRPSSEVLGKSWTVETQKSDSGVEGIVGTKVSYADVVQGRKQWRTHGRRGWKSLQQIMDELEEQINELFHDAMIDITNAIKE